MIVITVSFVFRNISLEDDPAATSLIPAINTMVRGFLSVTSSNLRSTTPHISFNTTIYRLYDK